MPPCWAVMGNFRPSDLTLTRATTHHTSSNSFHPAWLPPTPNSENKIFHVYIAGLLPYLAMSFRRKPSETESSAASARLSISTWRVIRGGSQAQPTRGPLKAVKKIFSKKSLRKVKPQRGLVCLGLAQQSSHDHFYTEHSWMEITTTAYVKWCLESLKVLFYAT